MRTTSISASMLFALVTTLAGASALVGCSAADEAAADAAPDAGKKKKKASAKDSDDDKKPSKKGFSKDAGARDGGDAGAAEIEVGTDGGPPANPCKTPLAKGDLAIVEVLLTAKTGTGDKGEWIEIKNTRSCTVNIKGLQVSSPRTATIDDVATVTVDTYVAAGGRFLVASSTDPKVNGGLAGTVIAFAGNTSDVLGNGGDDISIELGPLGIDTFGFDITGLTPGESLAFPETCVAADRGNPALWKSAKHSWAAGMYGTPNAPNTDVTCS